MLAALLLAAVAAASPRPVTVDEAAGLGMPRLHQAFSDCDCVGLTWSTNDDDLVLDVPRDQIRTLRHSLADDGQYELWLVHVSGTELLLERGPCAPLDAMVGQYQFLEVPLDRVGLAEPVCGDVTGRMLADLEAYEEKLAGRNPVVHVEQLDAIAVLRVTDRKGNATEPAIALQRGLRSLRPRLSQCLTLGEEVLGAELRLVVRSDGTVSGVKPARGGSGADRVDTCLVDLLSGAEAIIVSERSERLRAELTMPESTARLR